MSDTTRKEHLAGVRRIVVKYGTRMLTSGPYTLDTEALERIAADISSVRESGFEVVVVTSGAIATGMGRMNLHRRPKAIPQLQALAAIGQNLLMNAWEKALGAHDIPIGQVLLTRENINVRAEFLNLRTTLAELLGMGTVPIINENDSVVSEEVKVGDNDNLSSYVTSLVDADLLILFTDVDGLYTGDPKCGDCSLIPLVTSITPDIEALCGDAGDAASVGGMRTKIEAARRVLSAGGRVVIANGRKTTLASIINGDEDGTLFVPEDDGLGSRRHWIATTAMVRGHIIVDTGAAGAIEKKNASLLAKGVVGTDGDFAMGDVVSVVGPDGHELARGVSQYNGAEIAQIQGRHSDEIDTILGYTRGTAVIHRNDLVSLHRNGLKSEKMT